MPPLRFRRIRLRFGSPFCHGILDLGLASLESFDSLSVTLLKLTERPFALPDLIAGKLDLPLSLLDRRA